MDKLWRIVLILALTASASLSAPVSQAGPLPGARAAPGDDAPQSLVAALAQDYAPDQVLVKFRPNATEEERASLRARYGLTLQRSAPRIGWELDTSPPNTDIPALVDALKSEPLVLKAEPNYIVAALLTPNDPLFPQQWAPQKIQAPEAWDITTGSPSVTVAVIDSGIDPNHPEFQGKLVAGYDYVNSDTDPTDDYGHGTHVSGIAAAQGNNAEGIAGIAYDSKLMPLKILDSTGQGTAADAALAVTYAADQGVRIINMSFGSYHYSQALHDATDYAWSKNAILFAAVGNDNTPNAFYPAALPNVMGVGATDQNDVKASWSNWGTANIDIAGPGVSVWSTLPTYSVPWGGGQTGYGGRSGTSMAAPHPAGVAGLLLAQDGARSNVAVREIIYDSADDLGASGWDVYYGYGRINAYKAVTLPIPPFPTISNVRADVPSFTNVTILWDTASAATSIVEYWQIPKPNDPPPTVYRVENTTKVTSHAVRLTVGIYRNTNYGYRVKSDNAAGQAAAGDYTFRTPAK